MYTLCYNDNRNPISISFWIVSPAGSPGHHTVKFANNRKTKANRIIHVLLLCTAKYIYRTHVIIIR